MKVICQGAIFNRLIWYSCDTCKHRFPHIFIDLDAGCDDFCLTYEMTYDDDYCNCVPVPFEYLMKEIIEEENSGKA